MWVADNQTRSQHVTTHYFFAYGRFLDRATIPRHISLPALPFEHHWLEYDACEPQQVVERLLAADIVITNKVVLTREMLIQLPKLKLIAISATGTNNVDLLTCRDLNIAVCNVQGYATRSVPEHVVAMMFALRRNLIGYHNDIAAGEWQRHKQFCFSRIRLAILRVQPWALSAVVH